MVKINLIKRHINPKKEEVEIVVPQYLDYDFMAVFREHFTLELITGDRNILSDGSVQYKFVLDVHDAVLLKQAIMSVYTKISGFNTSN